MSIRHAIWMNVGPRPPGPWLEVRSSSARPRRQPSGGGRYTADLERESNAAVPPADQLGAVGPDGEAGLRSSLGPLALIGLAAAPVSGADNAGVDTAAQAQRGAALYDANCAVCHGVSLQGASAIALSGPTFQARWADGRHSVDDLFYIIRTLTPNNEPGSLARQQYLDIVTYILRAGHRATMNWRSMPNG